MKIADLKLSHKMLILVGIPLLFELAFVGALACLVFDAQSQVARESRAREVAAGVDRLMRLSMQGSVEFSGFIFTQNRKFIIRFNNCADQYLKLSQRLEELLTDDPNTRAALKDTEETLDKIIELTNQAHDRYERGASRGIEEISTISNWVRDLKSSLVKLAQEQRAIATSSAASQIKSWSLIRQYLIAGIALNIAIALFLVVWINKDISRRLKVLMDNIILLGQDAELNPLTEGTDEVSRLDLFFHKMAEALKEAAQKEKSLINNAVDVICSVDAKGKFSAVSPACRTSWGYESPELIGTEMLAVVDDRDKQATSEAVREIRSGSRAAPFENRVSKKDGSIISALWSAYWDTGEDSLFCVTHDISDRKQAEIRLKANEQRVRKIMDSLPLGLAIVDSTGKIAILNPGLCNLVHEKAIELAGKSITSILDNPSNRSKDSMMLELFENQSAASSEWKVRASTGEKVPVEVSLKEFKTAEGPRFLVIMADISERYELEKLKQQFVTMVSEDLRAPLARINEVLEKVIAQEYGPLTEDGKRNASITARNTTRLISLVNDLLDIKQIQDGNLDLSPDRTDIQKILTESASALKSLSEKKNIFLEVTAKPTEIVADEEKLIQVVINLLSNAVKFSPEGSTIKLSSFKHQEHIEVTVEDRGQGIPASHRQSIFERFQQVRASDASEKGGSGLGLAICKAIIESHGGEIGVQSEEGMGSKFWFRVPLAPERDR